MAERKWTEVRQSLWPWRVIHSRSPPHQQRDHELCSLNPGASAPAQEPSSTLIWVSATCSHVFVNPSCSPSFIMCALNIRDFTASSQTAAFWSRRDPQAVSLIQAKDVQCLCSSYLKLKDWFLLWSGCETNFMFVSTLSVLITWNNYINQMISVEQERPPKPEWKISYISNRVSASPTVSFITFQLSVITVAYLAQSLHN